ncbi:YcaO-like family protein [Pseudoalteromonas maricaloris]|uniref:YcaO-like family protein n=1 Tax=Pseudoalteromonas maricaloris TaxID=184924 RepID=UPI00057D2F90|nr:YcaO-like family protein [Pseudoalteromonas flavipulchra]KID37616.1 hypothetical protein QT15_06130 [Pseudoalteromonas flavipulchra NCIMB 2033 = ATCC BAA-314]MBE0374382.1 ribosomal protein S12 methylthiotransferase [Pseudoalteromonas flavipulchra NCIMB 2033 = ATCC BAA-314]
MSCNNESIAQYERSILPKRTKELIQLVCNSIQSTYGIELKTYRENYVDYCYAETAAGKELTYGLGKGCNSKIGAYGECIEHLLLVLDCCEKKQIYFGQCKNYNFDTLLDHASKLNGFDELEFVKFDAYSEFDKEVYIPHCLVNHNYYNNKAELSEAEEFFTKYSTTSGTAFGATKIDAILHGTLELLERHYTSLLYLNLLGIDSDAHFSIVNPASFPLESKKIYSTIKERSVDLDVTTITLTNSDNISWFLTMCHNPSSREFLPKWGAGCSLNPHVALYRSLTECLQMVDSTRPDIAEEKIQYVIEEYPALAAVFFLDVDTLPLQNISFECSDIKTKKLMELKANEQLDVLFDTLQKSGRSLYYRELYNEHGYVVTSYATNTEKFFNVNHCMPSLPLRALDETLIKSELI